MEKVNIGKVCRTCITEQENMLNISTPVKCTGTMLTVTKILNSFISKEIILDDKYPSLICTNCIELAVTAYSFKLQCDESFLMLDEYIKNLPVKTEEETQENIDNFNNNLQTVQVTIKEENMSASNLNSPEAEEIIQEKPPNVQKVKRRKYSKQDTKLEHMSVNKDETEIMDEIREINKELGLIYFCSKCNKSFKNKYIFNAHEKRHEFKGQFLCNVCGKGFSSQSCLNRHNRVHTGEKKYECLECHKRFPSSNNLNLHSRIHTGHKPYLCTICGKRFSHPTGLTYHMRTHTHEKPYGCELCGKRFAIQCHFDRHKKTHSGERPFPCTQCGRAFIKKIDLQRHEEIHTGLKPHTCEICKKSFLRIKNLNFHMMLHTEERPHMCPECGKGFIRSYYLRDHIRKHHK